MFFVYEMSPFLKEVRVTGMPLAHLFTKFCAIVGGVFTVLGVLDTLLFRLQKMCRRKT